MDRDITNALATGTTILKHLVADIAEDKLDFRPRAGIWTIREHLGHLVETQEMLARRLEYVLSEDRPVIEPYIPDDDDSPTPESRSIEELIGGFTAYRQRQLETIDGASEEQWNKTAEHPEYAVYTFRILVRHILLHDYFHMHRMEELAFLRPEMIGDL